MSNKSTTVSSTEDPALKHQRLYNSAYEYYMSGLRCEAKHPVSYASRPSPFFLNGMEDIIELQSLPSAAVVCYAFSAELILKLLAAVCGVPCKKAHKLKDIYEVLPDSVKEDIRRNYASAEFAQHIEDFSDAFIKWRYKHEVDSLEAVPANITRLVRACHKTLKPLLPQNFQWQTLPPGSKITKLTQSSSGYSMTTF